MRSLPLNSCITFHVGVETVRLLVGGAEHVRLVGGERLLQAGRRPEEEVVRRTHAAAERYRVPSHGARHGYHVAGPSYGVGGLGAGRQGEVKGRREYPLRSP